MSYLVARVFGELTPGSFHEPQEIDEVGFIETTDTDELITYVADYLDERGCLEAEIELADGTEHTIKTTAQLQALFPEEPTK